LILHVETQKAKGDENVEKVEGDENVETKAQK
jgi:hypothetical protein